MHAFYCESIALRIDNTIWVDPVVSKYNHFIVNDKTCVYQVVG